MVISQNELCKRDIARVYKGKGLLDRNFVGLTERSIDTA